MKILALVIAVMTILGTFAVPASAYTTYRQPTYAEANDLYWYTNTYLGLGDHPINAAIGNTYTALKYGRDNSKSYFYDSLNNKTHYANGVVIDGEPINTSHWDGTSYWDGQYRWYWDASSGYYYRIDQWGNKIWGSRSGGSTGGSGTSTANGNLPGYDYSYNGKPLYAGRITGIDYYVDSNQALVLARMLACSVKAETSETKQAAVAWSVLYACNGPSGLSNANLERIYNRSDNPVKWYDSTVTNLTDNSGRDLMALAKDVIFRYNAWKSGNIYVGQVLPNGYTWMSTYNNGITSCRASQYGDDYNFPDAWSANKSALHSPYTT